MGVIHVTLPNGEERTLDAVEGWRVMELLRDQATGVEGTCGGQVDCASCHVIVAQDWAGKLAPAREDEEDKLDELPEIAPTSRLSCQIIWDETLDGLTLILPEGA